MDDIKKYTIALACLLATTALLALPLPARAVGGITVECTTGGDELGYAVATGGDLDGDGYADVAIGAPCATVHGKPQAGYVRVISGRTHAIFFQKRGRQAGQLLGAAVAFTHDRDGDGKDELAVGSPGYDVSELGNPDPNGGLLMNAGKVEIFVPGRAAMMVFLGTDPQGGFGEAIAALPDIDGDRCPDIAVGAANGFDPTLLRTGVVSIYNARTGELIGKQYGPKKQARLGEHVADGGDVDGDGIHDVIAGAPLTDTGGKRDAGIVRVISGADSNETLLEKSGAAKDRLGTAVAAAGDMNGDDLADIIVGASNADDVGVKGAGQVDLYSSGGALLLAVGDPEVEENAHFGASVANLGDLNDDGINDFAVGAPNADTDAATFVATDGGRVVAIDGVTGTPLWTARGDDINEQLGSSLIGDLDFDGDGTPDVVAGGIGDVGKGRRGAGSVKILSGADGSVLRQYSGRRGLETRIFVLGNLGDQLKVKGFDQTGKRRELRARVLGAPRGELSIAVIDDDVANPGHVEVAVAKGYGADRSKIQVLDASVRRQIVAEFQGFPRAIKSGANLAAGKLSETDPRDELAVAQAESKTGDVFIRLFARYQDGEVWDVVDEFKVYDANDQYNQLYDVNAGGATVAVGNVVKPNALDEIDEIIVGTTRGLPLVRVFSNTGILLQQFLAYGPSEADGVQVSVVSFGGESYIVTVPATGTAHIKAFTGDGVRVAVPGSANLISVTAQSSGGGRVAGADIDFDGDQELLFIPGPNDTPVVTAYEPDGSPVFGFVPFEAFPASGGAIVATDAFARY